MKTGRIVRLFRWLEPLVTEINQVTHAREASKGAFMGWIVFAFDLGIVSFIVRRAQSVPHADIVFNFMEVITVIAIGYMVTHKMILLKSPFQAGNGTTTERTENSGSIVTTTTTKTGTPPAKEEANGHTAVDQQI